MNRRAVAIAVIGLLLGAGWSLGNAAGLSLTSQSLTPLRTCTVSATPASTVAVADTTVRQASPASNFGTATSLTVASSGAANQRTYVRFDLTACSPAIPSSATVRIATLRLFVTSFAAVCRTMDLFVPAVAWTEAAATWANQPFGTALNNPPAASRTGAFDVGTPVGCQNRTANSYVVGATVTSDVAAFVAGTQANLGWMIRDDVEGSATARTTVFAAKNAGTANRVPQLVVSYVTTP